jgi:hypothetical protein
VSSADSYTTTTAHPCSAGSQAIYIDEISQSSLGLYRSFKLRGTLSIDRAEYRLTFLFAGTCTETAFVSSTNDGCNNGFCLPCDAPIRQCSDLVGLSWHGCLTGSYLPTVQVPI